MSSELEKSRLAVAHEVKFDMLAAISELGDHSKQYASISRNFSCQSSRLLIMVRVDLIDPMQQIR
jgi:hypothetical protein